MLMNAAEYRESLRSLSPRLFVDGQRITSVADAPSLAPGIAAVGTSYDFAHDPALATLMTARQSEGGPLVNRMLHVNATNQDLLWKLEAVRVLCRESGCAQRYLAHDALNGIFQATARIDADRGTDYHQRFRAYLADVQERDLAIGIAMTDAKGDRSLRPSAQANPDTYVHVVGRRPGGIVISGTKAIVTGAPYMHQFLVMPCRAMQADDAAFAVCCAVPADAPGVTIVARPAGRPRPRPRKSARPGTSPTASPVSSLASSSTTLAETTAASTHSLSTEPAETSPTASSVSSLASSSTTLAETTAASTHSLSAEPAETSPTASSVSSLASSSTTLAEITAAFKNSLSTEPAETSPTASFESIPAISPPQSSTAGPLSSATSENTAPEAPPPDTTTCVWLTTTQQQHPRVVSHATQPYAYG